MKRRFLILLPLALAALPFVHSLAGFDLVWEDPSYIIKNKAIHSLRNIPRFFGLRYWNEALPTPTRSYRPLREVVLAADYALWGRRVAGYRLTSILLHMLATACAYLFLRAWLGRGGLAPALLGACVFALHPSRVETVVYVKNKAEIMAAIFVLLAARSWLLPARSGRPGLQQAAALGLLVLALLSKATAIALPFALLAAAFCRRDPTQRRRDWVSLAPMFLAAAICVYANARFIDKPVFKPGELGRLGLEWRPALVAKTWHSYLSMALLPVRLRADRHLPPPAGSPWQGAAILCLWIAAGLVLAWRGPRSAPTVTLGIAWFVAFLGPVLNILLIEGRPLAEQRLYLPLAGLALCAAAAARRRSARRLIPVALLAFAALSCQRVFAWQDSRSLWFDNVLKAPGKTKSRNNLGRYYGQSKRYTLAAAQFRKALAINPRFGDALYNMAAVCQKRGDLTQAVVWYSRLLTLDPSRDDAWLQVGGIFWRKKEYELAEKAFRSLLERKPHHAMALRDLAGVYRAQGRYGMAEGTVRKALALEPRSTELHVVLGETLDLLGRHDEATAWYRRAIELDDPDRSVYVRMGKVLYTNHRYDAAKLAWRKLLDRNPQDWEAHLGLGLIAMKQRDRAAFDASVKRLQALRPRVARQLAETWEAQP